MPFAEKRFCVRGHDTSKTGRVLSNKECRVCAKARQQRWDTAHKAEAPARWRQWAAANPVKFRRGRYENSWKSKGILNPDGSRFRIEDYDRMLALQNGVCRICGEPEKRFAQLSADHDHKTHIIRGLLCHRHNAGIGFFEESVEALNGAIKYLRDTGR